MNDRLTLVDPNDTYNFHVGQPVEYGIRPDGSVYQLRGVRLLARRVRHKLRHWTRWFRLRTVTSEVDAEAGEIMLVDERWSWRRWRWERL